MINVNDCKYEDVAFVDEGHVQTNVYYFLYPKDLGFEEYGDFEAESNYGNVVATCIALTVQSDGYSYMQISPTIEEDDTMTDVDWRDLYDVTNYTSNTIQSLINKAKGVSNGNK